MPTHLTPPSSPPMELRLPDLPEPTARDSGGWAMTLMPMLGSLASVGLLVSLAQDGQSPGRAYLVAGLVLLATLGFVGVQVDRQHRQRTDARAEARAAYLLRLDEVRRSAQARREAHRHAALTAYPDPGVLPARLRAPGEDGFLLVRNGTTDGPPAVRLLPPDRVPPTHPDPVCADRARGLVRSHGTTPGTPALLDLAATPAVALTGTDPRSQARALLCAAAAAHSPEHLAVAVLCAPDRLPSWDWVKWLPHAGSTREHDAVGPQRMVGSSWPVLAPLLPVGVSAAHLLLVVDGLPAPEPGLGRTVVEVLPATPDPTPAPADTGPVPDLAGPALAESTARRLARRRTAGAQDDPLLTALGLTDPHHWDPGQAWADRPPRERLRVPIGLDDQGAPVHLDLKESAQGGAGPHGLVIGATGSGKSELLRTLVLGLSATHSPADLNLLLIDFKGGATFAGLAGLPHTSALITNLSQELSLVDRMHDALTGELVRRQQVLRAAGDLASVAELGRAREAGQEVPALPALLVVVDEFSELLAARPELVELFGTIGRLGRSLGIHLLLASQRLEEGRLRGLEAHLSYRIGLRTFSAQESRVVLGVPDAHLLPPTPGLGYLRRGPEDLVRFRAGYVSGPAPAPAAGPAQTGMLPFTLTPVDVRPRKEPTAPAGQTTGPGLLELVVDRTRGLGPRAHPVWLPPLAGPEPLVSVLGDLTELPGSGLCSPSWRGRGLRLPVGVRDLPREQRREPLVLDLTGAGGHVAVAGAPRSGRSTLLSTLVTSAALLLPPDRLRVLVLDLGGGCADLAALPHVAAVAGRDRPDVVRRVVAEARRVLAAREKGEDAGDQELLLVVDGWGALRAEHEELEQQLTDLAARGLAHGVHLALSVTRWSELRPALRDLVGSRLELRLGEPAESEIDRRAAAAVPRGEPGRGLAPDGTQVLAAVADRALLDRVAHAWPGPPAEPLRLLPAEVTLEEVRRAAPEHPHPLLGLEEERLAVVTLDPTQDPHLLVLGEPGSGRSTLLRSHAREVARTRTPAQARLVVIDPRRTLLGQLPEAHLLSHLSSPEETAASVAELAAYLRARLPGPDTTPTQLRERSRWSGAEVVVLVDDHDLVAPVGAPSPLAPLVPLLPHARDIGLRLVLARGIGGAARALHEPTLQALRDLGAPGLMLSGRPEEGPLLGGLRPHPAPPGRGRLVTRAGHLVVQVAR